MQLLLKLIGDVVALAFRFAVFIAIAIVGGIGSAWIMIHDGSRFTTLREGPWVSWTTAGRMDADPYTRAHNVRLGLLPLNPSLALTYHARIDDAGDRLHSSCDYLIDLDTIDAQWWSLAAFDDNGASIRNGAQRYAFNAATTIRDPVGKSQIVLARDARPGNWLPSGGAGNLTLAFMVQDPKWTRNSMDEQQARTEPLPQIRKLGCRR